MFLNTAKLYKKIYKKIPDTKKFENLKNTESGSCYIFGDGVSIKYYDLLAFSNLPSISLANISLHNSSKFLKLRYSLLCDSFSLLPQKKYHDLWRMLKAYSSSNPNSSDQSYRSTQYSKALSILSPAKLLNLIRVSYPDLLLDNNDVLLNANFITHCSNYYFSKSLNNAFYYNSHAKLHNDIHDYLDKNLHNPYKSSLNFSIYLAAFLGFKKIYLVGCDYQDLEPRNGHWYEKGDGTKINYSKKKNNFIEIMKTFIEIKIITFQHSFEENYISYKDFTGKDLEYRENTEIIRKEKIDIFTRLWPWGDF